MKLLNLYNVAHHARLFFLSVVLLSAAQAIWLASASATTPFLKPNVTSRPRTFVFPIMSPRLASAFGVRKHPVLRVQRHHSGIDLAVPSGTPIRTIAAGTVVFADPYGSYGNLIVVSHSGGMTSHYGHCQSFKVKTGQQVKAGQVIGIVGQTGRVTGPHLHLEVRLDGKPQNPEDFITGLRAEARG